MKRSRFRNNIINIVTNPFFLAIPMSIINILLLPVSTSKYEVTHTEKQIANKPHAIENFHDLNNDGDDENVIAFNNTVKGNAAIKVLNTHGSNLDQWNFDGYFMNQGARYYCADLDKDDFPEIVVFYYENDSVFLGCIKSYPEKEVIFRKKFITKVLEKDSKIDFFISEPNAADIDNDGNKELVFILTAGYSQQPRCVFVFDFQDDTIFHSPTTGINLTTMIIKDLNNDSFPEIYCGSSSVGNIDVNSGIPFSDYSSWLVGFNHKLEFLFPPVENEGGISSSVVVSEFANRANSSSIVALTRNNKTYKDRLIFYDNNCEEVYSKTFEFMPEVHARVNLHLFPLTIQKRPYIYLGIMDNSLFFINKDRKIKTIEIEFDYLSPWLSADLNNDGQDEHMFVSKANEYLHIFDHEFDNFLQVKTNWEILSDDQFVIGVKNYKNKPTELFIKANEELKFYTYNLNPLYYFRFIIWIIIYACVVIIFWSIQWLQRVQIKRKKAIEDTINSLQLKTIKSQLDPHFMFNVLNGLATNVVLGKTDEAHNQILRFSTLMRSMINRVDRIDISIEQEIEFVRNYLELEKFRFKEDFNFEIVIDGNTDMYARIPRMLIQLLVENAIKHGLMNKEKDKKILITVAFSEKHSIISVEDNGIGREAAHKKGSNSGNGLRLINNMINLNQRLTGKKITLTYIDLTDNNGNACGTRAEVVI